MLIWWISFTIFVLCMLVLDLLVFHRKSHEIGIKEAFKMTCFWVSLALGFNVLVYFWRGSHTALTFLTGYLIEESLSMDNLFVFLLIFSYFQVDPKYRHKVLYLGILGALVMRLFFILAGVALINKFHSVIYIFGAILIFSGLKMAFGRESEIHPERNPILKLVRRLFPMTNDYHADKFFVKIHGKWFATPLVAVLVVVETTDLVFAVDSIPAILAITTDPFIVYTSNVFAILGLRALYFALSGFMKIFHYLSHGLSIILIFIGIKMVISDFVHIPVGIALGVVAGVLILSVIFSILLPKKNMKSDSPQA